MGCESCNSCQASCRQCQSCNGCQGCNGCNGTCDTKQTYCATNSQRVRDYFSCPSFDVRVGEKISLVVSASTWNEFVNYAQNAYNLGNYGKASPPVSPSNVRVSSGEAISRSKYNNLVSLLDGLVQWNSPLKNVKNKPIKAEYFNNLDDLAYGMGLLTTQCSSCNSGCNADCNTCNSGCNSGRQCYCQSCQGCNGSSEAQQCDDPAPSG